MTKAERAWMADITAIGCIACLKMGYAGTPGAVHHLLRAGKRIGHLDSICLCDPGHHQNAPAGSGKVSRHPNKALFEQVYGTELELLEVTRALVERRRLILAREQRLLDSREEHGHFGAGHS